MSLVIEDIGKTYKFNILGTKKLEALKHINIRIESGSVLALVGQNGAGKTTLIKCILNYLKADTGKIQFDEKPIKEIVKEGKLGYMPEILQYDGMFTLKEYVTDLMVLRGCSMKDYNERFECLVDKFHMTKHLEKPLKKYSKGNMKKATFIQAVLHNPQLLILDEPTDGLDPVSRRALLNEILEIKKNGGTVIITTHILSDLLMVADDIVLLQNGKIICESELSEISGTLDDWYLEKIVQYGGEER